jgi:predicted Zn-dependent protease
VEKKFKKWLAQSENSREVRARHAEYLISNNDDLQHAIELLEGVVNEDPSDAMSITFLAAAYSAANKIPEAEEYFTKVSGLQV